MTKKNAILILTIVVAIALGVIAYITFFVGGEDETELNIEQNQEQTFFPISNENRENENEPAPIDIPLNEFNIPRLRQIANVPVAGFTVFERPATTSNVLVNEETGEESFEQITETVYRYVERSTGHIYETTARSLDVTRITNTTIPKIYSAKFANDGENVVLQYLDENNNIETFVASVVSPKPIENGTSTDDIVLIDEFSKLEGGFLPSNIIDFDISPNQDDIFYLVEELEPNFVGRGKGYLTSFSNISEQENILDTPAVEWQVNWPNENIVTLNNKVSDFASGFLYFLNTNSESFTKILDGQSGFNSIVNSDLTKILFSENSQNFLNLSLYDLEENENYDLGIRTFIEKCVWGNLKPNRAYCAVPRNIPSGITYPDSWYQGTITFNDSLAVIDWDENIINEVSGMTIPFDVIKPQLSEGDDYFVFVNKKDLTLWSLDLSI